MYVKSTLQAIFTYRFVSKFLHIIFCIRILHLKFTYKYKSTYNNNNNNNNNNITNITNYYYYYYYYYKYYQ